MFIIQRQCKQTPVQKKMMPCFCAPTPTFRKVKKKEKNHNKGGIFFVRFRLPAKNTSPAREAAMAIKRTQPKMSSQIGKPIRLFPRATFQETHPSKDPFRSHPSASVKNTNGGV